MKGLKRLSGTKILLLILSMMIHYSAWGQFSFSIPSRQYDRMLSTSSIQVSVTGKLALCSHSDKGSIVLGVTGGNAPYTFKWNTNETTQNRSNLFSGTYTVKITDALGAEHTERIVIQPPYPLILNPVDKKDATCGGDGSAKISIKTFHTSREPYKITWSNGLKDVWEANDLTPGTYTVVVADKFNCDVSISFDIKSGTNAMQLSSSSENPTCIAPSSGKISLSVQGGLAPITYRWNTGATTKDLTGLSAGTYQVLISDASGCTRQSSFTLASPQPISMTSKVNQPSCQGSSTGELEVQGVGGQAPYTYLWSNGITTQRTSGLVAGTYTVRVVDALGCSREETFTIQSPTSLSLKVLDSKPVSCSGGSDGQVRLDLSNAAGSVVILWSDGVKDKMSRTDLKAGAYTVTATDSQGCTVSLGVNVNQSAALTARIESALDVDCEASTVTGLAWVSIQGGKEPYKVTWSNGSQGAREINFSSSGILKVTVEDALGCKVESESKVDFPVSATQGGRLDFQYRKLTITNDPEVLVSEEVLFESEISPEFIAWEWEFGDGQKSVDKDPIHTFKEPGTFEVTLTGFDQWGCSMVEKNSVQVSSPTEMVVIPNAFSPNGDGLNDTFLPKLRGVTSFHMEIFNTWGEKLYISSGPEISGWDGTYKGQLVPAGNYLYRISYIAQDGTQVSRSGGITLIR